MLRDVAREACDLAREPGERTPALRLELAIAVGEPRDLLPHPLRVPAVGSPRRSEEHTSELQSLMRISYAVFCLKTKTPTKPNQLNYTHNTNHYTTNEITI